MYEKNGWRPLLFDTTVLFIFNSISDHIPLAKLAIGATNASAARSEPSSFTILHLICRYTRGHKNSVVLAGISNVMAESAEKKPTGVVCVCRMFITLACIERRENKSSVGNAMIGCVAKVDCSTTRFGGIFRILICPRPQVLISFSVFAVSFSSVPPDLWTIQSTDHGHRCWFRFPKRSTN